MTSPTGMLPVSCVRGDLGVTVIRKTWMLWLVPAVLGIAVGFWVTSSVPTVYRASTTVLALQSPASTGEVDYASILATKQLMPTLIAMLRSNKVLEAAADRLGSPWTVTDLRPLLGVAVPSDTVLLVITLEGSTSKFVLDGLWAITTEFLVTARASFATLQLRMTDEPAVSGPVTSTDRRLLWLVSIGSGVVLGFILALLGYNRVVIGDGT